MRVLHTKVAENNNFVNRKISMLYKGTSHQSNVRGNKRVNLSENVELGGYWQGAVLIKYAWPSTLRLLIYWDLN